jgi:hypothetical protein
VPPGPGRKQHFSPYLPREKLIKVTDEMEIPSVSLQALCVRDHKVFVLAWGRPQLNLYEVVCLFILFPENKASLACIFFDITGVLFLFSCMCILISFSYFQR